MSIQNKIINIINVILLVSILTLSAYAHAADNTAVVNIKSIELRDTAHHAIFVNGAVPFEGCDLSDRAILIENVGSGRAMLGTAMLALGADKKVTIRVDGCTEINPGQTTLTAPRAVKMQIYK